MRSTLSPAVPPAITLVAVIKLVASMSIEPSLVSTEVRVIPLNSSTTMSPEPLTVRSALFAVTSKLMPVVASAVRTSAETSFLSSVPSWVMDPVPAFKVTSPDKPALILCATIPTPVKLISLESESLKEAISVAVIAPPVAITVMEPLEVSTSAKSIAPVCVMVIAPDSLVLTLAASTSVTKVIAPAASATKSFAVSVPV